MPVVTEFKSWRSFIFEPWRRRLLMQGHPHISWSNKANLFFDRGYPAFLVNQLTGIPIRYRVFDQVIVGDNPIFNAIALLRAAQKQKRVLLVSSDQGAIDNWPYGLLTAPEFIAFVNRAVGHFDYRLKQAPQTPNMWSDQLDVILDNAAEDTDWIEFFLNFVVDQIHLGSVTRLDNRFRLEHLRENGQEAIFRVLPQHSDNQLDVGKPPNDIPRPRLVALKAWQKLLGKIDRLTSRPVAAEGTYVLTADIIITSQQKDFCISELSQDQQPERLDYVCPFVRGFGSAGYPGLGREDMLSTVLEDILRLSGSAIATDDDRNESQHV
ncbi:MAG: hypothetical protein AAF213_10515 [Pseudomonadota bacterium]